jgi:holin-like protein
MLGGFVIIMLFLLAGEALHGLGLPLPGNVTGMILLAVALRLRIVRREWVAGAANFLVENLSLLFVPAGVGVMAYFNVVERSWLPISLSVLVSTLVVLAFTGVLEDRLRVLLRRRERGGRGDC